MRYYANRFSYWSTLTFWLRVCIELLMLHSADWTDTVIYLKSGFICLFICSVLVLFLQRSGGSCLV